MRRLARALLLPLLLLAAAASPARAERPPRLRALRGEQSVTAEGVPATLLVAEVDARFGLGAADFTLRQLGGASDSAAPRPARRVRSYRETGPPLRLVIVVEGFGPWMNGGEDGGPDAAYPKLREALEVFSRMSPAGSRAALIAYGADASRPPAWVDPGELSARLGAASRFSAVSTRPLGPALLAASELLAAAGADTRRALLVVGDGVEDSGSAGPRQRALAALTSSDVELYALRFGGGEASVALLHAFGTHGYHRSDDAADLPRDLTEVAEALDGRYRVEFSAEEVASGSGEREFSLAIGGREVGRARATVPAPLEARPDHVAELRRYWWIAPLALGLFAITWLLGRWLYRRPRPLPAAGPALAAPPPSAAAQAAASQAGLPRTAWVVPLSGPQRYRTFVIAVPSTRIGTGATAGVVVQDDAMSAEHAEIAGGEGEYVLADLGSTNGTFVADHRVIAHPLRDGDVFVLGQTPFVFKSVT